MPSYEYEIQDGNGKVLSTLTFISSVESRDAITIKRKTVPQRVAFLGTAPDNPHDANRVSIKKLAKYENQLGGPEFRRRMGMPAAKAAEVWKQPQSATT